MTRRISFRPFFGVDRLFAGLVLAGDVLDADHQAGFAGDGHAVGEPAGAAAHALDEVITAVGLAVGQQVAHLGGEELDGGEVAEGEVDAHVVVVDRLRQVDDGNPAAAPRQLLLEELELVGGFQRVVAADGDQRVDLQRDQRVVDRLQRRDPLRVLQVGGVGDVLARIGPRRADQNPLAVARDRLRNLCVMGM